MNLYRRSPEPVHHGYEVQMFSSMECDAEFIRSADRTGKPHPTAPHHRTGDAVSKHCALRWGKWSPNHRLGRPRRSGRCAGSTRVSLLASCKVCAHETVLNVNSLPDTVPLSWFASRFVCKCCDAVGTYISPSWSEKPDGADLADYMSG